MDRRAARGRQKPGRDGLPPVIRYFRTVFPDLRVRIEDVIVSADGTLVTVRTVYSGTQRASFLGIAPTGARISFRTTDVHRVSQGRIAQTWHLEDTFGAYTQLRAASPG